MQNTSKKEEKMRNKERLNLLGDGHKTGLWYPGSKTGESIVPQDSRITL